LSRDGDTQESGGRGKTKTSAMSSVSHGQLLFGLGAGPLAARASRLANAAHAGSFPEQAASEGGNIRAIFGVVELVPATGVCYPAIA
jgi:hypothetical protein